MKDDDKTVVIEASYGEGKDYKKAHISGALHIDTMEIETEENNWNILDAEICKEVFLKRGVTKTTPVVVYSSDINAAARVAFVAYWLGVDNVKILDGGLKAWEKADYKVEKGNEEATAAKDFGAEVPGRPESLISTSADVLAAKEKNPDLVLASIRSWKEFTGKTSGYDYIENAGEPEGAVYAKSSKTSADVAQLMNNNGTVKEPTKIFVAWENGESLLIRKSLFIVEQAGARLLRSLSRNKKAGKMLNCSMAAGMTGIKHTKKIQVNTLFRLAILETKIK